MLTHEYSWDVVVFLAESNDGCRAANISKNNREGGSRERLWRLVMSDLWMREKPVKRLKQKRRKTSSSVPFLLLANYTNTFISVYHHAEAIISPPAAFPRWGGGVLLITGSEVHYQCVHCQPSWLGLGEGHTDLIRLSWALITSQEKKRSYGFTGVTWLRQQSDLLPQRDAPPPRIGCFHEWKNKLDKYVIVQIGASPWTPNAIIHLKWMRCLI